MNITTIKALEILDSRGNPTVKAYVTLGNGTIGEAAVPSGASTGSHESIELRDATSHYQGEGVRHAVDNINTQISAHITGMNIENLESIDAKMIELDGTENKSHLGANAILAVSLASARALSAFKREPLWKTLNEHYFTHTPVSFPRLMVNVINGGAHAGWNIDIQEYMISPKERDPQVSIEMAANIFHMLKSILKEDGFETSVGDEGGFAPSFSSNDAGFEYIQKAIEKAGYTLNEVDLATDIAASEFFDSNQYNLKTEKKNLSSAQLLEYYGELIRKFNIMSFEDPFNEDDWEAFTACTEAYGKEHMIVGDDAFVTNIKRIQKGIDMKSANAVLVKVNQIGSLSEAVSAINATKNAGWKVIISHRSGETSDPFISDLAYACGADFIKSGSMSRSERLAKYNRLLEIKVGF